MEKQFMITLPAAVRELLQRIQQAGYEAYAVGGCVRDSMLGREPGDWDVTTSALPWQVKEIFPKTIDTGIQHGTVTVMMNRVGYEVTTYRIDGEYEDGRHPDNVTFTGSLLEDLKRRDFTINAMAYNEKERLVDAFQGRQDMEKKIIRCVGDARCRFEEDALRLMRAVRFSAQLGYSIEENTAAAMKEMAPRLRQVSAERIQTELIKLLMSDHPDYLRVAYETGLTKVFLQEFDCAMETEQNHPHHCYSVGEHLLNSLLQVKPDKILRLAMLFHDIGKPQVKTTDDGGTDHFYGHSTVSETRAREILKRLKFDNDTIRKVCRLVKYHDLRPEPTPAAVRKAMVKIGPELFEAYLQVQQADLLAQSKEKREEKQQALDEIKGIYQQILVGRDCLTIKDLALTGQDLKGAGMKPGKAMGDMLQRLLEHVLECPEDNRKEVLLAKAEEWKEKEKQ